MNDFNNSVISAKMPSATIAELNNNSEHVLDGIYRPRSESRASTLSSASSSNETSEEKELPELSNETKSTNFEEVNDTRRFRSMSDGSPTLSASEEPFEVFPSLPDSVLEKMGLLGDGPRERLNEEESEQKFVGLALAFSIDATTIKDRCQRQRRYRDQTEKNLTVEIDRLMDKIYRLQPLCVDAETTEMLTDLLTQTDIVTRASAYACISAERFGAVQHEDRLAQSVEVMIKHVTLLKQQRDSARKHLQYTKRMLQNTNNLTDVQNVTKPKNLHSRRASIAIISQHLVSPKSPIESKRISRRTSELSIRASALPRPNRPSRLELGVDLVKIKEGTTEETNVSPQDENMNKQGKDAKNTELPKYEHEEQEIAYDTSSLTFRERMTQNFASFCRNTTHLYDNWCDNGTMHEICIVATLLCFSLSIIILVNILIELEHAKCDYGDSDNWNFGSFWTALSPDITHNYDQERITS